MIIATISDFMTTRLEVISFLSKKAAKKMRYRDVCSSVVINGKVSKVLGLIPERDIVRNVCIYNNVSINCV